jgi:arginine repressor
MTKRPHIPKHVILTVSKYVKNNPHTPNTVVARKFDISDASVSRIKKINAGGRPDTSGRRIYEILKNEEEQSNAKMPPFTPPAKTAVDTQSQRSRLMDELIRISYILEDINKNLIYLADRL